MITYNFKSIFYQKIIQDLNDVLRLFSNEQEDLTIYQESVEEGNNLKCSVVINDTTYEFVEEIVFSSEIEHIRLHKRHTKIALYNSLSAYTGQSLEWGSVTGIRPVKLFSDFVIDGDVKNAVSSYKNDFFVSDKKTELVLSTYNTQKRYYNSEQKAVDVYVGIPFCLSRCSYCSFVSADINKVKNSLVESYVSALIEEVKAAKELIAKCSYTVRSFYLGGGTPTALTAGLLKRLLDVCDFKDCEYTVEAGRPDSITREKLEIIKDAGANRISVNPQTANNGTLKLIGRSHSFDDFVDCYIMASGYGFIINCDLIAGLHGENLSDFKQSLKKVVALAPQNITLHSLALKKGSILQKTEDSVISVDIDKMLDYGYKSLLSEGYLPYYMYRLKNTVGNNENIGFAKEGVECIYNIDNMHEDTSVIACGANGISKRVFVSETRIERVAAPKDIATYLEKYKTIIDQKEKLFY